jgi:cold shock CspA family protein
MKKVSIVTTTILLFSTGCAVTIPVRGSIGGKDDFMGTAIATLSEGNMQVISQSGLTCTGVLTRPSLVQGTGTIKCSDGRSGNFVFVKTNDNGGTGIGSLSDGAKIRFSFGNDMRGSTVHCDKDSDSASCTNF